MLRRPGNPAQDEAFDLYPLHTMQIVPERCEDILLVPCLAEVFRQRGLVAWNLGRYGSHVQGHCEAVEELRKRRVGLHECFAEHYRKGQLSEAAFTWQDAAVEIDRMHQGACWRKLLQRGGQTFVNKIAEEYFQIQLNVAHVHTNSIQKGIPGPWVLIFVEQALTRVTRLTKAFRQDGCTWKILQTLKAKLQFRLGFFTEWRDGMRKRCTA